MGSGVLLRVMTNEPSIKPAYAVVVPNELQQAWSALDTGDSKRISKRLAADARAALADPTVWPDGAPGQHRGRHRVLVGELWVLYRLNDAQKTLNLIGFGRVHPSV